MDRAYLSEFEERLEKTLPIPQGPHKVVYEAARYSLLSGGKRLRPLLVLVTADALGGSLENAYPAALAIEMIHTYSLIHDDLPGMDNDDFRRGKASLHKVYTEGQAILAGDLLLTEAFALLANAPLSALEMIKTLSQASGGLGMIGGQAIDLLGTATTRQELETLHRMKSGALIAAAVDLGAIAAEAAPPMRAALKSFALSLGLAFQIIDDVLDVTQAEKKHGHKISSDAENDKTTFVTLLGIDGSKEAARTTLEEALSALPYDLPPLRNLAHKLVYREG